MNWEQIFETVQKYWVQQVCVVVLGMLTYWYRKQIKKLEQNAKDQKALKRAMMALQRDRFYQGYKHHIQTGYYPIKDREIMQDIYDQYHALGGNGVITHLMEELEELPTYPNREV